MLLDRWMEKPLLLRKDFLHCMQVNMEGLDLGMIKVTICHQKVKILVVTKNLGVHTKIVANCETICVVTQAWKAVRAKRSKEKSETSISHGRAT